VAELRPTICENTQMERKVERNGTAYTQDTSRIGKRAEPAA